MAAWGLLQRAQAAHLVRSWPVDKATPALDATDLDGKSWTLAALKGRPVMLNFWASWCEPCRAEMPSLQWLATRYAKDGLVVLSVNYKEAPQMIRRYQDTLQFSLPVLLDPEGDMAAAWTPRVFPTTVLIERGGAVRSSVIGELDWTGDVARALVAPLLVVEKRAEARRGPTPTVRRR